MSYTGMMDMIEVMKHAALAAGEYMAGSSEREQTNKTNAKDFVTVADIKSQNILRDTLHAEYPDAVILSEEDSEQERQELYELDFTGFVLDPIDGTYNFKRDMKESAISVGYIERGVSVAGVVYDPYRQELYWAGQGMGAYCNGSPIAVSGQQDMASASVTTSNSYDSQAMARNLARHMAIYEQTREMPWTICAGSGVLIWMWVACGRTDAYHHNGLKPWDNAAAFCIAQEAGAVISRLDGSSARFTDADILVATPEMYAQLRAVFGGDDFDTQLLR